MALGFNGPILGGGGPFSNRERDDIILCVQRRRSRYVLVLCVRCLLLLAAAALHIIVTSLDVKLFSFIDKNAAKGWPFHVNCDLKFRGGDAVGE